MEDKTRQTVVKTLLCAANELEGRDVSAARPRPKRGPKVTIYHKSGTIPGLGKFEGYLESIEMDSNNKFNSVNAIKKGARRISVFDSYYFYSLVLVVDGWGKPDPGSAWNPAEDTGTPGVRVQKSKYRSTDPRWVDDFLGGSGGKIKPLFMFREGKVKVNKLPQFVAQASVSAKYDDKDWDELYKRLKAALRQAEKTKKGTNDKVVKKEAIRVLRGLNEAFKIVDKWVTF